MVQQSVAKNYFESQLKVKRLLATIGQLATSQQYNSNTQDAFKPGEVAEASEGHILTEILHGFIQITSDLEFYQHV